MTSPMRPWALLLTFVAVLEHGGLLWIATGYSHSQLGSGNFLAFLICVLVGFSAAAAGWLYVRAKRALADAYERIYRTSAAAVLAPWTAVAFFMAFLTVGGFAPVRWVLAPFSLVGWMLGPAAGSVAPYVLVARTLLPLRPR